MEQKLIPFAKQHTLKFSSTSWVSFNKNVIELYPTSKTSTENKLLSEDSEESIADKGSALRWLCKN